MDDILYPKLTEKGKEEAALLVKSIVKAVIKELDDNDFYCNIPCYIQSDSWINFRNSIMDGFNDYANGKANDLYDFKHLREVMLRENYDQIIKDIDQDNLDKIKDLEKHIEILNSFNRY